MSRMVAKLHVLDVLDQVVVSGYVYDAQGPVSDGEAPIEVAVTLPSRGVDEPLTWLLVALSSAIAEMTKPA